MLSSDKGSYHPDRDTLGSERRDSNYADMAGSTWGCMLSLCGQECRVTASVGTEGEPGWDCHRAATCHRDRSVHTSGVSVHVADIKHPDVHDTKSLPDGHVLTRLYFPLCS